MSNVEQLDSRRGGALGDAYRRVTDSLISFFSGLGGPRDKAAHAQYALKILTAQDLENAFRCDWIARKVVTIPAADATREWRSWQAENDQIEAIEEIEKKLKVRKKVKGALIRARLYGGAALIMGIKGQRLEDELDIETVKKDQFQFLHVVSKNEISAGEIERDMESEYYGQPKHWIRRADAATSAREIHIHPSRVIPLIGAEIINESVRDQGIWGDSILLHVDDAVRAAGLASQGIASLIEEMKYDVIKIPELATITANKEAADRLALRFTYANNHKSILNALLIDGDEEWETKQLNLSGMPDILQQYLVLASGAADIPVTRMLGQSPAGLNSTGESDLRNYYDFCASIQNDELTDALERLDEVIIRSALGDRDPDIYYEWRPLWQQSELEKADVNLKNAQAFKVHVDSGLIPDAALAEAFVNKLIEDGTYPGLEDAIADLDFEAVFGPIDDPIEPDPITGMKLPASKHPDDPELKRIAAKPQPKLLAGPKKKRATDSAAADLVRRWHQLRDAQNG